MTFTLIAAVWFTLAVPALALIGGGAKLADRIELGIEDDA